MAVRIVTDSACDLSTDEAASLGIQVVPLSIRFGTEEFVDRVDLSVDDFYRRLAGASALPETAAPSPGAFEQAFRTLAADGAEAVVCVNLSSDLSATMQSARTAAASVAGEPGIGLDIRVVDSRSVTHGLGSQVVRAAEAAAGGAGVDEVEGLVRDMAGRTRVYGALDTLEYLRKGGRIGGAQAMLGQLLSIKPIVDVSTGVVKEAAKARTRRKALQWLAAKALAEPRVENLAVMHGQAPDVDEMVALLAPRYGPDDIHIGLIGAVIGTHGGPHVMGVTFQLPTG